MLSVAVPAFPVTEPVRAVVETPEETISRLTKRLEEIDAIDKKTLTKEEKKELRGEVKEIKKEMKRVGGGVYVSIGAALLVLILLLILL
jgi:hypothetical protein